MWHSVSVVQRCVCECVCVCVCVCVVALCVCRPDVSSHSVHMQICRCVCSKLGTKSGIKMWHSVSVVQMFQVILYMYRHKNKVYSRDVSTLRPHTLVA